MKKAILKADAVPLGKDKTLYGKKGERVNIISEHEGKDGPFCIVSGIKDGGFPVSRINLNFING